MLVAITRGVSPSIGRCELTHLRREPIDVGLAAAQHGRYERCLAGLGCEVVRLPAEPGLPDSVFVEDTAVVLDEVAVVARPGTESRRPETTAVAATLERYRGVRAIEPPGALEGGDVLVLGKDVLVGRSSRTNAAGIEQLRRHLAPFGYEVVAVGVKGCLHLKSAVTEIARGTLLANRAWVDGRAFEGREVVEVDPAEPFAANALLVSGTVVYPAAHVRTRRRLEERGIRVETLDLSELAKAEGGVTCCCLLLREPRPLKSAPVVGDSQR